MSSGLQVQGTRGRKDDARERTGANAMEGSTTLIFTEKKWKRRKTKKNQLLAFDLSRFSLSLSLSLSSHPSG